MRKNKLGIIMNKKLEKFIDVFEWEDNTFSLLLKDLDENFWFESKEELQQIITTQCTERFSDNKQGYFDYTNEHNEVFRYKIEELRKGEIIKFSEGLI